MSENSRLPIDIVVGLDKSSVGIAFADLEAKAISAGRKIGDSMSKAMSQEKQLDKQVNTDRYFKQAQAIDSVTNSINKQSDALRKLYGARSPQYISEKLNELRKEEQMWRALGPATEGYKGSIAGIRREINILTEGNARARGTLHQLTAGFASLAFEVTGAIYGLSIIGGILAGPAIFGGKFLSNLENSRLGISAIVLSMAEANGQLMNFGSASAVADQVIVNLGKEAIRTANSTQELVKVFQAIAAPAFAAGMNVEQITKLSVVAGGAVKAIGLDSRQMVQEIRDLVAGGIVASSSTLAMSLGLNDEQIKAARDSAEGLFAFLMRKLEGFNQVQAETANTFSGKMTVLSEVLQKTFGVAFAGTFDSVKVTLDSIIGYFADIDKATGTIELNPAFQKQLETTDDLLSGILFLVSSLFDAMKSASDVKINIGGSDTYLGSMAVDLGLVAAGFYTVQLAATGASTAMVTFGKFASVAIAGILGYELGSWLRDNSEEARKFGAGVVVAFEMTKSSVVFMLEAVGITAAASFTYIGILTEQLVDNIKTRFLSIPDLIAKAFGKLVGGIGSLLDSLGFGGAATEVMAKFSSNSAKDYDKTIGDLEKRNSQYTARIVANEKLHAASGEEAYAKQGKAVAEVIDWYNSYDTTITKVTKADKDLSDVKRKQAGDYAIVTKEIEKLAASLGIGKQESQQEMLDVAIKTQQKLRDALKQPDVPKESADEYTRQLAILDKLIPKIDEAMKKKSAMGDSKADINAATAAKDDYAKQSAEINDALNAGTTTFEQAYEKRKAILKGYIAEGVNVKNFQAELSKITLDLYKVESAAIEESVATGVKTYAEGYDAKVAMLKDLGNKGLDAAAKEIELSNLRKQLAKDSTAAMKDIDAATAKYADTMSAGERVIADFNNATKDKINIMEKEMVVLKALPKPTQEQKDKLEALTKSTDAYNKANVMVTETISPLAQALSNLAKITRETDAAIDKIDLEASLKGGGPLAMLEAQNLKLVELQNQYVRADEELKKFVQTQIDAGNTLADYDAETLERYTQLTNGVDKHRKAAKDLENQLDKTFGKGAKQAFEEYQISAKDTASQANNLFSNMFKNIEDAFTNFIMTGKMDFKAFVNSMIADLARMAAKQIVLSFLGVTGMAGSGVAGASQTISTGSNLLGLAGGLMPSATGAGLLYGAGSWLAGGAAGAGATGMAGIGTGMMATANMGIGSGFLAGGQALLAGPAASGVSSSAAFGAMVPGIGVALAGIALLASFIKDKGGPKVEGNAFGTMNASGGMNIVRSADYAAPYGDGDWGRPGADAGKVEAILAPVGESIAQYINGLGGSASGIGFAMGFNTDPEGEAPDNVMGTVRDAAGNDVYRHVFDTERGKGVEALQEEIPKMMLAAAQAVDISPITNALLDGITNIEEMSVERANDLLSKTSLIAEMSMDDFTQLFGETTFDPAQFDEFGRAGELTIDTFSRLAGVFGATNAVATMLGKDAASAFGVVGLASTDMRQKLINGAGGMDKLTEQAGFFYQSFYSESERASKAVETANNQVIASFAEMGIAVPKSEAEFRSLVEGLDLGTDAGQAMYQKLMDIAPAFDAVAEATKAATNSIASSLDKLRGNNAASTALATINRNNAMADLAAKSDIETIDQLLTISAEDLAAYAELNPAIYLLIAAALDAEATLQGLGDSATTAAAAAAAYSNSISMGEIISNSQAIVDGIMSTISGTVGTGFSATATTQITAMQDLITRTQEELAATPTTGDYTGNREQLRSIIHDANQQINILTSDLARYTELEAQYAGHGEALLELEKWYNSQLGVYQQYGISSTSLVEEFERRKLEILASGGADTVNGVTDVVDALKNSFSQLDSLIKLSDSIEDSINSVLAAQGDYQSGLVTVNRRLEEAREKLNNAVGIDEQTKAAGELKSAIMARYQAEANEIARIQSLISQLGQLSDRIRGSIESIKSSMLGYSGVNYATEQVSKGYAGLEDATTTEEQIIAADKLKEAIMGRYSAEMSDLQKRKDAENEAGRASVEATNKLNAAFRALGDYAKELLTGAESALTSPAKLAETQRQYDSLLTLARGGDVEAAGNIQGLASNLLGQSRDASVTALDYARSFSKVQGAMSELGTMAGTDREYAENTAKWEAETLGIQNRTIDELTLLGDLTETWITELEDTLPDLEALQQSTLEELERLNQLTVEWQEAINDSIIEQAIQFMQLNLTASQIAVELSGLDSRIAAIINATQKAILVEPDYTFTTMQLDSNIPGFASGGDHDGGWRVVGESGPELEYTQPSNIYSSSKSSDMFTSLATELSELRSELAASRQETLAANRAIAKNSMETAKMLQKWDGDGQPEVRVV